MGENEENESPPRRRWTIALALVGALAVLALAFRAASYLPLVSEQAGAIPGEVIAREGSRSTTLTYRDGARLTTYFEVRNAGRFGITVLSIEANRPGTSSVLVVDEVRVGLQAGSLEGTQSFRPFALHGGEKRVVYFVGHLSNCESYGPNETAQSKSAWQVTFRVAGVRRSMLLSTHHGWFYEMPPLGQCPRTR